MSKKFDAKSELQEIHQIRKKRRLPRYWRGRSQLDQHAAELLELNDQGASANDLRIWLQERKKLSVDRSTVCRWLQKANAQRRAQAERQQ